MLAAADPEEKWKDGSGEAYANTNIPPKNAIATRIVMAVRTGSSPTCP